MKKLIDKSWLEEQLRLHKSLKEISRIVGCSQDTVKRNAIDYGILYLWSKGGVPYISKEELDKYNNEGLSQGEIAKIHNVSQTHIGHLFERYNMSPCKTVNKLNDLTGKTFGRWTVIKREVNKHDNNKTYWLCKCSCNKNTERAVTSNDLISGKSTCCGCIGEEKHAIVFKEKSKHNMAGTKFYTKWVSMKGRCLNKDHQAYKNYGGRGIKICEEWLDKENGFINFYNDMYKSYLNHCEQYGERDTTLDRKDNNGNYSPDNCRWATIKEQNQNKRGVYNIS